MVGVSWNAAPTARLQVIPVVLNGERREAVLAGKPDSTVGFEAGNFVWSIFDEIGIHLVGEEIRG